MKKLLVYLGIFGFLLIPIAIKIYNTSYPILGDGIGTIPQLNQFVSTTSPVTGITQQSYGKSLILTGLTASSNLCLDSNNRVTTSGCTGGGGGSGGGTFSTTTSTVSGRLINYPNNTTDIVTVGGTATTTAATEVWFDPNTENYKIGSSNTASTTIMGIFNLPTLSQGSLYLGSLGKVNSVATTTPTVTAPITYSGTLGSFIGGSSGTFDCISASSGVKGCITGTDWDTFNNKQALLVGTTGQVAYFSGTNTAIGTSTIFISTAGNVGFNKASPSFSIDVNRAEGGATGINTLRLVNQNASGSGGGTGPQSYTGFVPVATGDRLGYNLFGYTDGTTNRNSLGIFGYANQGWTPGTNQGSYLTFETTPDNSASRAERLRVAASGNIGIGSTTPGSLLSVGSTAGINFFDNATSTFGKGIDIRGGCFSINGVCVGGSGASGLTSYDAWTHATVGLSATTSALAISTSTNPSLYPLTVFSSNLPQLSLSAGTGIPQWTFRNAGGDLYLATTTVAGTATTTGALGFSILGTNGFMGVGTSTPGSIFSIQGVANFVANAVSTIYNSLRILGTLVLPNIGTPAGAFLAVDANGNVIATSTPTATVATTTQTMSLFKGANLTPDTGGNAWFEPYSITATADVSPYLVGIASSTTAKTGFYGQMNVPRDYNNGCSVTVKWTAPQASAGNAVFDFAYIGVAGTNSESLDQAFAETVTATTAGPTTAQYQIITTLGFTCTNIVAGDTLQFYISRDGADANDTLTSDVVIHDVILNYSN